MEDYFRQAKPLKDMRRALDEVSTTVTCRDGLVTVAADPRGQVQDIRFAPKVYRKPPLSELSRSIIARQGLFTATRALWRV
ncbi:YbaB/EbfC family nucleoid-associated protein [Actinoallomurus purpureus]|uniref:YbaB/EbfC family nucleoid-associated protein n=1 Tax=Actinoallomurus purpureus TaxID=478114 RepID=UPI0020931650|nr:YbaB/EbfC family nucleoid-associated protein [Actinoallomurus purpureus]MCO6011754.1 YbaB/EbfC family nucleoid-associated protein [Actinoallomurus purpureus]